MKWAFHPEAETEFYATIDFEPAAAPNVANAPLVRRDVLMKKIILLVQLFSLSSCAQKWGVYTIMHEEKLPNGCSVRTIRHEDNVRCQVLRGKELVGELDVDDGHIKTIVSSFNKMNEGVDENISGTYNFPGLHPSLITENSRSVSLHKVHTVHRVHDVLSVHKHTPNRF